MVDSYTTSSFTSLSYTTGGGIVNPPLTGAVENAVLSRVFVDGVAEPKILEYTVVKQGERGVPICSLKLPISSIADQGSRIEVIVDAVGIKGLEAIYHFEKSLRDESGIGRHGSSSNTTYVAGKYGYGVNFNGTNASIMLGDVIDMQLTDLTICFWFKLGAIGLQQALVTKRNRATSTNKGFAMYVNSANKLVAEMCDGSAAVIVLTGTTTLTTDVWYYAVAGFDRNNLLVSHLDGVSQGSIDISTQQADASNAVPFTIGAFGAGTSNYANMVIDELRVYSRILVNAEKTKLRLLTNLRTTMKFGGIVWNVEDKTHPKIMNCKGYLKEAIERSIVDTTYIDKTPEFILSDIISDYTSMQFLDFSATPSSVLESFEAKGKVIDIVESMVETAGKTYRTNGIGDFILDDIEATTLALTYTHGTLATKILEHTNDDTELINEIVVIGDDVAQRAFVDFSYVNRGDIIPLEHTVIGGVIVWSVSNAAGDTIIWTTNWGANDRKYRILNSNTIEFGGNAGFTDPDGPFLEYDFIDKIKITVGNATSIAQYGKRTQVIIAPAISTVADATALATELLALHDTIKDAIQVVKYPYDVQLEENSKVTLVNPIKAINAAYVVKSIKYEFPYGRTTLTCGEFKHNEYEIQKKLYKKLHSVENVVS